MVMAGFLGGWGRDIGQYQMSVTDGWYGSQINYVTIIRRLVCWLCCELALF